MTRLEELGERLARACRGPAEIESQLLFRMAGPLFALAGWRAKVEAPRLAELVAMLGSEGEPPPPTRKAEALAAAVAELERNVVAIERVTVVKRKTPLAHALWLRRVHGVLTLVEATCAADLSEPPLELTRAVARTDPSALLPPLTLSPDRGTPLDLRTKEDPDLEDARLVDLELCAIDHLMAAARAETALLGRKRRLLVAARQRLLEASAALPLEPEGLRARTRYLAREITRLDRLEAASVSTDVALVHQARQALARGDPHRLFATLSALDASALAAGDREVSARTGRVLARLTYGEDRAAAALASLRRSAEELLGDVAAEVSSAVDDARSDAFQRLGMGGAPSERTEANAFLRYLPEDADVAITRAAIAADGFFEVGGALAAVRVTEEERVRRVVRQPTQSLVLTPAEDVHDLRDAVIGDPRSILLDLATGRLFARRFVREEVHRRSRVILRGEVRVYVLDGSGSMQGPRARVRDAILVAELSTLIRRLESPGDTRATLYYRYFNEDLGLVSRVASVQEARAAIRQVVATERSGGTDIQKALLASLAQVAEAAALDPSLARAQIVLVTDGESSVDEATIVAAREAIELPIGVSVVALGQENTALRALVARQRAKGEAAFYHYLADAELAAITEGSHTLEDAIHAPERWSRLAPDPEALARALEDEVGGLLDELEQIERARDVAALERLEEEAQARREVGLSDDDDVGDGEQARLLALRKDRVALEARFARWFPSPAPDRASPEAPPPPRAGTPERDDVEAVSCALASVAEVVALLGGTPLARQADAIELLERLLPDANLSPSRYRAVLREHPAVVGPALRALHEAVRGRTHTDPG